MKVVCSDDSCGWDLIRWGFRLNHGSVGILHRDCFRVGSVVVYEVNVLVNLVFVCSQGFEWYPSVWGSEVWTEMEGWKAGVVV